MFVASSSCVKPSLLPAFNALRKMGSEQIADSIPWQREYGSGDISGGYGVTQLAVRAESQPEVC